MPCVPSLLPLCSSYSCLVALQLLEGKTAQQALDKVKSVLVPTMVAGAVFWPAANLLSKCRWVAGTGTQDSRAHFRSAKWPTGPANASLYGHVAARRVYLTQALPSLAHRLHVRARIGACDVRERCGAGVERVPQPDQQPEGSGGSMKPVC